MVLQEKKLQHILVITALAPIFVTTCRTLPGCNYGSFLDSNVGSNYRSFLDSNVGSNYGSFLDSNVDSFLSMGEANAD